MFSKRSLVVFAAAFALVLISGAALAQVGSLPLGGDGGEVTDIFAGDFDQDPEEESPTPPDEGATEEKEQERDQSARSDRLYLHCCLSPVSVEQCGSPARRTLLKPELSSSIFNPSASSGASACWTALCLHASPSEPDPPTLVPG